MKKNVIDRLLPSAQKCGYDTERFVVPRPLQIRPVLEKFATACQRSSIISSRNNSSVIFKEDMMFLKKSLGDNNRIRFIMLYQSQIIDFVQDCFTKQEQDQQELVSKMLIRRDPEIPGTSTSTPEVLHEVNDFGMCHKYSAVYQCLSNLKYKMGENNSFVLPCKVSEALNKLKNRCKTDDDVKHHVKNNLNEKCPQSFMPPFQMKRYCASEHQDDDEFESLEDMKRPHKFLVWLKDRKYKWNLQKFFMKSKGKVSIACINKSEFVDIRFNVDPVRLDPILPQYHAGTSKHETDLSSLELPKPRNYQESNACDEMKKKATNPDVVVRNIPSKMLSFKPRRLVQGKTKDAPSFNDSITMGISMLSSKHPSNLPLVSCVNKVEKKGTHSNQSALKLTVPPKIFRDHPYPSVYHEKDTQDIDVMPKAVSCHIPPISKLNTVLKTYVTSRTDTSHKKISFSIGSIAIMKWAPKVVEGYFITHDLSRLKSFQPRSPDHQRSSQINRYKILSDSIIQSIRSITSEGKVDNSQDKALSFNLIELNTSYHCRSRFEMSNASPFMDSFKIKHFNECREKVIAMVQNIRSKGMRRVQGEAIHLLLGTGTRMRREISGKCIYRGFLSGIIVKCRLYEKRYLIMLKREAVDRSIRSYHGIFDASLIPSTISALVQRGNLSACSVVLARFEARIFQLALKESSKKVNKSETSTSFEKSYKLSSVDLLRSRRRYCDSKITKISGRKRCNSFGDGTIWNNFEEYIDQDRYYIPFFLCETSCTFTNTFESLFDHGNNSIVFAAMKELGEDSIQDCQELAHLVHRANDVSRGKL